MKPVKQVWMHAEVDPASAHEKANDFLKTLNLAQDPKIKMSAFMDGSGHVVYGVLIEYIEMV